MRSHPDWLTFTMTMRYSDETNEAYANAMENAFMDTFGASLLARAFGGNWAKKERSRAPYMDAWQIGEGGISLYASPTLTHCCVEISGEGCERLLEQSIFTEILIRVAPRVTRFDLACDIETETKPKDFVDQVKHERMRASGYQSSETGETCYVGSQKSDRYARVYRYFPPHPRCHLLRVEHVFRKDYAKAVASAWHYQDETSVVKAAGDAFGWDHGVWDVDAVDAADISIVCAERKMGGTVRWLITSAAPAFQRLVAAGTIKNPEQFIRQYFLSE